ncbi:Hypothetical predicted protein [Pelobates cultripes]|uniref:Uncharacterized protein n=1 Tax=Pelobates cultripes TaxID=61616 RepID=A0AAD1THF9_PELCU|nr:Hypothetical predicted protein [Pelobates cultripes]
MAGPQMEDSALDMVTCEDDGEDEEGIQNGAEEDEECQEIIEPAEVKAEPAEQSDRLTPQEEEMEEEAEACAVESGARRRVWVIGQSYIYWAQQRAEVHPGGLQLGLSPAVAEVRWFGSRGMRWKHLLPEMVRLARLFGVPDVLLIHLGGSALGTIPVWDLGTMILEDLAELWLKFPGLCIVWSEVLSRNYWSGARDPRALERSRIKLNKRVSKFVKRMGGVTVRHRMFEQNAAKYFKSDGVRLTEEGLDLFNLALQGALEEAMALVSGQPC